MLIGVIYLLIDVPCTGLIGHGWSRRLFLLFLLALWNALKSILVGPWSFVLLIRAQGREMRVHSSAGHTKHLK